MPTVQDFAKFAPYSFEQLVKAANSVLRNRPRLIVNPRTVRYYISEGVLPAPIGATRNARYEAEHLARLVGIRLLQDQGLSLAEANVLLTEWAADGISRLVAEVDRLSEREPSLDSRYEILSELRSDPKAELEEDDFEIPPFFRRQLDPKVGKGWDKVLGRKGAFSLGARTYDVVPGVELRVTDPKMSEVDILRIVKHLRFLIFRLSKY